MTPQRSLDVDLEDLMLAFEDASGETATYLDLESGEVIPIVGDVQRELEAVYDEPLMHRFAEVRDEAREETVLAEVLEGRSAPEWLREAALEARRVDAGLGTRYVRVPPADSREGYEDMEAFIDTVGNGRVQDQLWDAIHGRGAFRRFKDVLARYPSERERWFAFKNDRLHERALEWLAELGIEPTPKPR